MIEARLLACMTLIAVSAIASAQTPLPHATAATGTRDIARAWLAEPTGRYAHGVLGDALEAGALVVDTRDGARLVHRLPEHFVFEDLVPRLADVDRDGRDEVIVVRADARAGAALVVYGVEDGALVEEAASPPIGRANRWLNPIGAADLDGDGAVEIAWIETPHIGGVLRVSSFVDGRLVPRDAMRGLSNHAIGSTALGLHALVDVDGDGTPEIVAPTQARDALVTVDFRDGRLSEIGRVALPAPVTGDIVVAGRELLVPTERGRVRITPAS